jgi:hypothetical protein
MTRIIDDRGRLFGKINVVDILVLLIIVVLAVFIGLRANGGVGAETETVKITFLVQPTESLALDGFTTLGPVRDVAGRFLGTIESAKVVQPDPVSFGGSGIDYDLYFPSAPEVLVVVSAQATVSGTDVHVGSLTARVGTEIKLVGPGWEAKAQVIKVDRGAAATK